MTNSVEMMTSYLFGELSEAELARLEARYFEDRGTFNQLVQLETELVDSYARGGLSAQMRERFERGYLVDNNRRARLGFSEALAARVDELSAVRDADQTNVKAMPKWQKFSSFITGRQRALAFSMALALLLFSLTSAWLFIKNRRLEKDLARTRDTQIEQGERQSEVQQQLAREKTKSQQLAAELERERSEPKPQPTPTMPESPTLAVASLVLTASGARGIDTGAAPKLVIHPGTHQVRFQLNLKENEYRRYHVALREVGGREIFNRQNFKPRITRSGATFTFSLPASLVNSGDYLLMLKGLTKSGDLEDVSESLFRVEKK